MFYRNFKNEEGNIEMQVAYGTVVTITVEKDRKEIERIVTRDYMLLDEKEIQPLRDKYNLTKEVENEANFYLS